MGSGRNDARGSWIRYGHYRREEGQRDDPGGARVLRTRPAPPDPRTTAVVAP